MNNWDYTQQDADDNWTRHFQETDEERAWREEQVKTAMQAFDELIRGFKDV